MKNRTAIMGTLRRDDFPIGVGRGSTYPSSADGQVVNHRYRLGEALTRSSAAAAILVVRQEFHLVVVAVVADEFQHFGGDADETLDVDRRLSRPFEAADLRALA